MAEIKMFIRVHQVVKYKITFIAPSIEILFLYLLYYS